MCTRLSTNADTELIEFTPISSAFLAILASMHHAAILHGNLQPDNLLINDSGDVAITDFDKATITPDTTLLFKERQSLEALLQAAVDGSIFREV